MADLSKEEKEEAYADAVLDAATPKAAPEISIPDLGHGKLITKKIPKKPKPPSPPLKVVKEARVAPPAPATAPTPTPTSVREPKPAPTTSNDVVKKAWKKINAWGLGISGKVVILLIVIGVFSEILKRF